MVGRVMGIKRSMVFLPFDDKQLTWIFRLAA
jgi:hypothetical protein